MPLSVASPPIEKPKRDTVDTDLSSSSPPIVSISDIHGYYESASEALFTLRDHPDYEPIVTEDSEGKLHWAENNYVLVFNGDLIDRGPSNEQVLEMVARLIEEAPQGRVRVTLGNHEWMIMLPNKYKFADWYSTKRSDKERQQYLQRIKEGHVVAAYEGYNHTYAHAGARSTYDVETLNDSLVDAASELSDSIGTTSDSTVQSSLPDAYPDVLGTGSRGVKGKDAGLVWISFDHLSADAPPQVVGHTRHIVPKSKGNVHCQDILQDNLDSIGGQGVFIETPDSLVALIRDGEQGITTQPLN